MLYYICKLIYFKFLPNNSGRRWKGMIKMVKKKKEANARKRKAKEIQEKRRYLLDTGFQIETLKWVFLSFALIIFGGFRNIKYLLLFMLVFDLMQTKYLFNVKWSKYLKYLVNALIIFLFILNLRMFILRNIVELIFVIMLIYIFNEKYRKNHNKFVELDGGKNEE